MVAVHGGGDGDAPPYLEGAARRGLPYHTGAVGILFLGRGVKILMDKLAWMF